MSDKSSHLHMHIQFLVKLQCSVLVLWAIFLSSATLFLEGRAETIVSPKFHQTKAGQNNKYYMYYRNFRSYPGLKHSAESFLNNLLT